MKVKFANAEVEVWKIKPGAVVYDDHLCGYFHIKGFYRINDSVQQVRVCNGEVYACTNLTWLEPH